jgi:1,2-diacylglycerol 3-alpha-glucosyltransferase
MIWLSDMHKGEIERLRETGMRVSIFFFDFGHYHVARCSALINLLRSRGGEACIYALREKAPDRPVMGEHDLLGQSIRVLSSNNVPINSWTNAWKMISVLNQDQPEAVAIPGYRGWPSYAALTWCKLNSRIAVLLSESQRQDFQRSPVKEWFKRRLVKQFDAALVGGAPHVEYALELGLSREVIFTGYDVVDNLFWERMAAAARQNRDECSRRLGLPAEFFLASCRFIPKKNLEGLITAYARYVTGAGEAPWHLVICGSGPLDLRIRSMVDQLGLQDKIHLPGYQDSENMAIFYGMASAFVHASSYAEQWGLVVNEAMASGLPVLVSRVCGCAPELVREGINGFTFDPFDLEGLARLMLTMSSGEVDLKAMRQESKKIIANFTPEIFANNLLQAVKAGRDAKHPDHSQCRNSADS